MTFKDLHLVEPILKAVSEKGYETPTPIQEQSIPIILRGKDLLGCAQTGTGKTAAFTIPILQNLYLHKRDTGGGRAIKALVITPTRELAIQIDENMSMYGKYTGLRNTVIFGGVKQHKQVRALRGGIDLLVATPGRLLDLINQRIVSLDKIEFFVLDEADQMLDMGFIHDIKKVIAKLPRERQSLFFSATMTKPIIELSNRILDKKPEMVTIKPEQATAEKVEQCVYHVAKKDKRKLLAHILNTHDGDSVLVFSRTKHGADRIVRDLKKVGITAAAIHGNKAQAQRQKALGKLKSGELRVLVATDIAARGIDVSQLALVINFDLPNVSETYVHRIGRTGRASASGIAMSFCDVEEKSSLRAIERLIKQTIPVIKDHPFAEGNVEMSDGLPEVNAAPASRGNGKPKPRNNRNRNRSRNRNNPNQKTEDSRTGNRSEGNTENKEDNRDRPQRKSNNRNRPNRNKRSNDRKEGDSPDANNNNRSGNQSNKPNPNRNKNTQNKGKKPTDKIGAPAKVAEPNWDDWD